MTKAGPAIIRCGLYQAGEVSRQWDPQLAYVYYRAIVYHGKNHMQAMRAVMSHLGARILAVEQEDRTYELRDTEGKPVSQQEARRLILSKYLMPDEIRRQRRRQNRRKDNAHRPITNKQGMTELSKMQEAASAPQSGIAPAIPKSQSIYSVLKNQADGLLDMI